MKRYYDLIAQIVAVLFVLAAIGGMLSGSYLMMAVFIGLAVLLFSYSKYLHKKEQRMIFEEDNPISAQKKRMYDEEIIARIKNAAFDPVSFQLGDIKEGSMLEYDLQTWSIDKLQYVYWKKATGVLQNQLSKQATMNTTGNRSANILVHQDLENQKVPLTQTVSAFAIDGQMDKYIKANEFQPPNVLTYKSEQYFKEATKVGYSIDRKDFSYQEFTNFEYYNEDKSKVIRLNYWGGKQLEAEIGEIVNDIKFSNILPAPDDADLRITDGD